jgi:hypothetical protein
MLLVGLLLSSVVGVLHGQEQESWYLISETELLSIEGYKKSIEQERQTWLLQVSGLRTRAEKSEADSKNLNSQLSNQRQITRSLTESFNKYEQDQLTLISSKNGEIAGKDQEIGELKTEVAKEKGQKRLYLVAIISVAVLVLGYVAIRICSFLRIIPV